MSVRLVSVGPIYPTRFPGLEYVQIGPDWRYLDEATGKPIGPRFPTRIDLLMDVDRFARITGFIERGVR